LITPTAAQSATLWHQSGHLVLGVNNTTTARPKIGVNP
jgi:hypothetical protein